MPPSVACLFALYSIAGRRRHLIHWQGWTLLLVPWVDHVLRPGSSDTGFALLLHYWGRGPICLYQEASSDSSLSPSCGDLSENTQRLICLNAGFRLEELFEKD